MIHLHWETRGISIAAVYVDSAGFWLRVFGRDVSISKGPFRFSERYGYAKAWKLGGWKLRLLEKQ